VGHVSADLLFTPTGLLVAEGDADTGTRGRAWRKTDMPYTEATRDPLLRFEVLDQLAHIFPIPPYCLEHFYGCTIAMARICLIRLRW
jgi:hypothetical protein